MNSLPTIPLFPSGRLVATPGALGLLEQTNKEPLEFLSRHLRGDWGNLDQEDKTENELSLKHGFRLLSSYQVTETEKLWVITEADHLQPRCSCRPSTDLSGFLPNYAGYLHSEDLLTREARHRFACSSPRGALSGRAGADRGNLISERVPISDIIEMNLRALNRPRLRFSRSPSLRHFHSNRCRAITTLDSSFSQY